MNHYATLKTLCLLLLVTSLLNSCSTGYEASRYSHLKYVKKQQDTEQAGTLQNFSKEDLKKTDKTLPSLLQSPESDMASVEVKPDLRKINSSNNFLAPAEQPLTGALQSPLSESNANGSITGQPSYDFTPTFKNLKALAPADITQDQHKLLLLWIILAGAAIVLSLLITASWVFGVFATVAGIAALVFFILWIINIAKS